MFVIYESMGNFSNVIAKFQSESVADEFLERTIKSYAWEIKDVDADQPTEADYQLAASYFSMEEVEDEF